MGLDISKIQDGIEKIVRFTMIAAQPIITSSYHTAVSLNDGKSRCFEILGFDILIDEKGFPWLLEVNCMPSLASYSQFDAALKSRVISQALKIVDLQPNFRRRVTRTLKRPNKCSITNLFDENREMELAKNTEWKQLLPVISDENMVKLVEEAMDHANSRSKRSVQADSRAPRSPRREETALPAPQPRPPRVMSPRNNKVSEAPVKRVESAVITPKPRAPVAVLSSASTRAPRPRTTEKTWFVLGQKQRLFDQAPIMHIFDGEKSAISMIEERERNIEIKKRARLAVSMGIPIILKGIFRDGRNIDFEGNKVSRPVFVRRSGNEVIREFFVSDSCKS
jgi:hypothetical protein